METETKPCDCMDAITTCISVKEKERVMGSGMNHEQAEEYAKTMTYREAVMNLQYARGIAYKKATRIKLRELAEIADMLDKEKADLKDCDNCGTPRHLCKYCIEEDRMWTPIETMIYPQVDGITPTLIKTTTEEFSTVDCGWGEPKE